MEFQVLRPLTTTVKTEADGKVLEIPFYNIEDFIIRVCDAWKEIYQGTIRFTQISVTDGKGYVPVSVSTPVNPDTKDLEKEVIEAQRKYREMRANYEERPEYSLDTTLRDKRGRFMSAPDVSLNYFPPF